MSADEYMIEIDPDAHSWTYGEAGRDYCGCGEDREHDCSDFYDSNGVCTGCGMSDPSSCLLEGTPILMADGTTKTIETIKPGELIQSYDPITNKPTEAVVIGAYATGANKHFNIFKFTDGRELHIYGRHGFYDEQENYIKDIRDITEEDTLLNINNDTIKLTGIEVEHFDEPQNRYVLISSNNLYYANGILLGHSPWCKFKYIEKYNPEINKEIYKLFEEDLLEYRKCRDYKLSKEFKEKLAVVANESLELKNACNKLRPEIRTIRKDKELLKIKKDKVDTMVFELNDKLDKLNKVRHNYKAMLNAPRKDYFKECCKRDNKALKMIIKNFNN